MIAQIGILVVFRVKRGWEQPSKAAPNRDLAVELLVWRCGLTIPLHLDRGKDSLASFPNA